MHPSIDLLLYAPGWNVFKNGSPYYVVSNHGKWETVKHLTDLPSYGYDLALVPRNAMVDKLKEYPHKDHPAIRYQRNMAKIVIAFCQLAYASTTLYQSRGHQIQVLGYTASGLTVAPYAVMSFINLVGALVCPDFGQVHLVHSSILDEARTKLPTDFQLPEVVGCLVEENAKGMTIAKCEFRGAQACVAEAQLVRTPDDRYLKVTRLSTSSGFAFGSSPINYRPPSRITFLVGAKNIGGPALLIPRCNQLQVAPHPIFSVFSKDTSQDVSISTSKRQAMVQFRHICRGSHPFNSSDYIAFVILFIICASIISIVGGISGFKPEESTLAQRFWTMAWLGVGLSAPFLRILHRETEAYFSPNSEDNFLTFLGLFGSIFGLIGSALLIVPAIGGLVVVGQMLKAYGNCTPLT